jgi:hypothetical protein
MIKQPPAILAGRVHHGPGKSGLGHETDQLVIRLAIDKHHAHDLGSPRRSNECPDTVLALRSSEKANLDVVNARRRHRFDSGSDYVGFHWQITYDGTCRPPPCNSSDRVTHNGRLERPQRTPCGIFQVNNIGAMGDREFGFLTPRDAC